MLKRLCDELMLRSAKFGSTGSHPRRFRWPKYDGIKNRTRLELEVQQSWLTYSLVQNESVLQRIGTKNNAWYDLASFYLFFTTHELDWPFWSTLHDLCDSVRVSPTDKLYIFFRHVHTVETTDVKKRGPENLNRVQLELTRRFETNIWTVEDGYGTTIRKTYTGRKIPVFCNILYCVI